MNYVWNQEGVQVGSITMNRWDGMQMWTSGFALYNNRLLQWQASAMHTGWYIVIDSPNGKLGEFQGSTLNLPVEIAAAIRRIA